MSFLLTFSRPRRLTVRHFRRRFTTRETMGERVRPSECETEKEDREKGRKNDEEERADKV